MAVALIALVAGGCTSTYDPDVHPTRLEPVKRTKEYQMVDLDGDGDDEFVRKRPVLVSEKGSSLVIKSPGGRAVAQVNFASELLNLSFRDVNEDGRLEIIAPVIRGDSLFYSVVSADGRKLHHFFAVEGDPRKEPSGSIEWDPRHALVNFTDVTADGSPELVSFFRTGFARQPRGVWVHSFPEGARIGACRIGALASTSSQYFRNVDADEPSEWLFGSKSTNNGARAGGMSDDRAYLGAIEVSKDPSVEWAREMGEKFSKVVLRQGDLNGDGSPEFVALRKPRQGRQSKSPLLQIDSATGETLQRFHPSSIIRALHVGALGPNNRDRILLLDEAATLRVLNAKFEVVHRRTFEAAIQSTELLSDINGDGHDEIVVGTDRGTLWLGEDLSTIAATQRTGDWKIVQTGTNSPPHIAISGSEVDQMTHFRAADHRWWWAYRYGPETGLVLVLLLMGGGAVVGVRRYQRFRLREAVRDQVVAHSDREWLLVHPRAGVEETSAGLSRELDLDTSTPVDMDALRNRWPELADHLHALAAEPGGPQTDEVTVDGRTFTVTCTPLEITSAGRPYWLVWLDPPAGPTSEKHRMWGLMAQRVAHDLKNPLTSILLTIQRMQMEYRQADAGVAETLDSYTERIEERIASLRRMTTNVLKFTGQTELRRTPTNMSAFVEEASEEAAQSLPPDIELRRELEEDLPVVSVDQDQMQSVLENLVSNAVEAMPEGGRITLTTRLERDLRFEDHPARDYVVVEVLDTGTGFEPAQQDRLFEPGFSTHDGTGLGLPIVRKIIGDHDGHIEIESELEVGTCITLYLPVGASGSEETHVPETSTDSVEHRGD
ncbi:MAG: PAS domain-containing sensor histidine kinase [Salinibacter sp.]